MVAIAATPPTEGFSSEGAKAALGCNRRFCAYAERKRPMRDARRAGAVRMAIWPWPGSIPV